MSKLRCGSKSQTPENLKRPLYFIRGGIGIRDLEQIQSVLGSVEQCVVHSTFILDFSYGVRSSLVGSILFFFFDIYI